MFKRTRTGLFWFVSVLRGHANKTADEYDTVRSEDFITKGLKDFTKFTDGGFHEDLRVANYFNTFVFLACQRSVHTKVPLVKPRPQGLLILKFLKNCIFD